VVSLPSTRKLSLQLHCNISERKRRPHHLMCVIWRRNTFARLRQGEDNNTRRYGQEPPTIDEWLSGLSQAAALHKQQHPTPPKQPTPRSTSTKKMHPLPTPNKIPMIISTSLLRSITTFGYSPFVCRAATRSLCAQFNRYVPFLI
jgi:hypothetical protein